MTLVLVHGTYGRADEWHKQGSLLRTMASDRGMHTVDFLWSGALFGIPTTLPGDPAEAAVGADDGKLLPWLDAGEKLAMFLEGFLPPVHVLSHSHGLQVVAFAAAEGVEFDTAISVSGPVRRDMQRARRAASAHIKRWIQYADPTGMDKVIIAGEMSDGGDLKAVFALPEGQTILTPDTGHHGALYDGAWIARMLDSI